MDMGEKAIIGIVHPRLVTALPGADCHHCSGSWTTKVSREEVGASCSSQQLGLRPMLATLLWDAVKPLALQNN